MYLYSFGDPSARLVLRHVSYGMVSPYEEVPAGDYTVSMRAAGAAPTAPPVLSTGFAVIAGDAYTVAGMGPASGLRLQVLKDTLAVPPGPGPGPGDPGIAAPARGQRDARRARPGAEAGVRQRDAVPSGHRRDPDRARRGRQCRGVLWTSRCPDTVHTLLVLDGPAACASPTWRMRPAARSCPAAAPATGLGGTAPHPAPSPLPWLAVLGRRHLAGRGRRPAVPPGSDG